VRPIVAMSKLSRFFMGARVISGDVCLVRLSVTSPDDGLLDDFPMKILGNSELRLRDEIADAVKQSLGQEFEVRSMTIGRGSVEILVLIGTTYYVVSRYKSFVESMELMVRQVKEVVRRYFERTAPMRVLVSGSWTPVGGIIQSSPFQPEPVQARNTFVVWYLILSHAGMLIVLLWLLVKGLKP
jgi:hypothetical protein